MEALVNFENNEKRIKLSKNYQETILSISEVFSIEERFKLFYFDVENEKIEIYTENDYKCALEQFELLNPIIIIIERISNINFTDMLKKAKAVQQIIDNEKKERERKKTEEEQKAKKSSLSNSISNREESISDIKIQNNNIEGRIQDLFKNTLEKFNKEKIIKEIVEKLQNESRMSSNNSKIIEVYHYGYKCIECGASPIIGVRYNCSVCENINFCEDCESYKGREHGHPLLKLKKNNNKEADIQNKKKEFIYKSIIINNKNELNKKEEEKTGNIMESEIFLLEDIIKKKR